MPATTRARTGSSKPRIIQAIESSIAPTKKTPKANTSKPRSTTGTASGRVTKTTTVKKPRTKTEKVIDKIVGSGEKVVGDVEGKPGKKAAGTRKARGTDSMTRRAVPKTKTATTGRTKKTVV
ncbi:hypothetical protein DE146DRAFT_634523 [Phaeosphaeria sp. MPI-PUGE-AT-0046c]|nr:hypothetical protein DE146DRAFT_634523 [Phaeosphaeria sp. MPI-PUGE-AT-0046c]